MQPGTSPRYRCPSLLDGLIELRITDRLSLAFNYREWTLALTVLKNDQVSEVARGTVGDGDLDPNPLGKVTIPVNQFGVEARAYFLFRI